MKKVNGKAPINRQKYAGGTFDLPGDLGKKYENGVKFSVEGYPDFSPYAEKSISIGELNKNRSSDFDAANKYFGFDKTPEGMTWHHVENSTTLQLIPTDLHKAVNHTGGVARNKAIK